jgi:Zn-dependent metalloprotease
MSLTPKLLSFAVLMALGGTASAGRLDNPAVDRALGLIAAHGAAVKASPADAYVAKDIAADANGTEHVRFDRTYAGLPVIGGDFVVHSRNGQLLSTSLTQGSPLALSTRASLSQGDAIVAAGSRFGSDFTGSPSASLVVYARGQGAAQLAYQVRLEADMRDMTYIVNAHSGKVIDSWSNFETTGVAGTGKTLYSGNQSINVNSVTGGYELRDQTRNIYTTDFNNGGTSKPGTGAIITSTTSTFGNNATSSRATVGADAHFGVAKTFDFYATLGRNGIDGTGKGTYNRTHVGRSYVNAFWSDSCFCMSYGDGDGVTYGPLVDIDVAGHEMTHGVTSRSANLTYSGESGGLNESMSDIFGTMVEFYANNATDPGDYLIGEKIYIKYPAGNHALRYMFHPSLEGAGRSVDCYSSTVGSLDVHYSSGPSNHYFYLLAEGSGAKSFNGVDHTSPTCNGSTVTGIGRDAAAKIQYRALTVYMTSSTNYAGARTATLKAATDLYGAGSTQYNAVAAAWSAVNVN